MPINKNCRLRYCFLATGLLALCFIVSACSRNAMPDMSETQPVQDKINNFTLAAEGEALSFEDGRPAIRVAPVGDDCAEIEYWMEKDPIEAPYKKGSYCDRSQRNISLPQTVLSRECVLPWLDVANRWLSKDDPKDLYGYHELRQDLDGDGAEDILIAPSPCGKAGCSFRMYVMRGLCGYFIGEHTGNLIEDHEKTISNGWQDIYLIGLEHLRSGFYSYAWDRLVFKGHSYRHEESRNCVKPDDEDVEYCQDWQTVNSGQGDIDVTDKPEEIKSH